MKKIPVIVLAILILSASSAMTADNDEWEYRLVKTLEGCISQDCEDAILAEEYMGVESAFTEKSSTGSITITSKGYMDDSIPCTETYQFEWSVADSFDPLDIESTVTVDITASALGTGTTFPLGQCPGSHDGFIQALGTIGILQPKYFDDKSLPDYWNNAFPSSHSDPCTAVAFQEESLSVPIEIGYGLNYPYAIFHIHTQVANEPGILTLDYGAAYIYERVRKGRPLLEVQIKNIPEIITYKRDNEFRGFTHYFEVVILNNGSVDHCYEYYRNYFKYDPETKNYEPITRYNPKTGQIPPGTESFKENIWLDYNEEPEKYKVVIKVNECTDPSFSDTKSVFFTVLESKKFPWTFLTPILQAGQTE